MQLNFLRYFYNPGFKWFLMYVFAFHNFLTVSGLLYTISIPNLRKVVKNITSPHTGMQHNKNISILPICRTFASHIYVILHMTENVSLRTDTVNSFHICWMCRKTARTMTFDSVYSVDGYHGGCEISGVPTVIGWHTVSFLAAHHRSGKKISQHTVHFASITAGIYRLLKCSISCSAHFVNMKMQCGCPFFSEFFYWSEHFTLFCCYLFQCWNYEVPRSLLSFSRNASTDWVFVCILRIKTAEKTYFIRECLGA